MYLRFALPKKDIYSPSHEGVFTVCYALLEGDGLESYEAANLRRVLEWFERCLPAPECLENTGNRRAICWFKCSAHSHLEMMWELVALLRTRGVSVEFLKT
jgi:hypothetical protein